MTKEPDGAMAQIRRIATKQTVSKNKHRKLKTENHLIKANWNDLKISRKIYRSFSKFNMVE